jgi:hypothetical protein
LKKALFPPDLQICETVDKGHGRLEIRTIRLIPERPVTMSFPFIRQIFSIERVRLTLDGSRELSRETVYGGCTHNPKQTRAPEVLKMSRDHWCIENSVHHVRDVTYNEDKSRIRTGNGPHMMAILRNIGINLMRSRGVKNIKGTIDTFAYDKKALFSFLGLTHATLKL